MKKIVVIILYLFIKTPAFTQDRFSFPVGFYLGDKKNDWVWLPDFLRGENTLPKDSVRRLSFTTFELTKNHEQRDLLNWLSSLKNIEELYIIFPPNSGGAWDLVNDSTIFKVNKIFQNKNIKFVRIDNADVDSADYILKHLLAGINTIKHVCFQYNDLPGTRVNLPDFIYSCPSLKNIAVLSTGYPVILEKEFLAKFPHHLQTAPIKDRLYLLYALQFTQLYQNMYSFTRSIDKIPPGFTDELYAVFLGNIDNPEDNSVFDMCGNDDSVLGPIYMVNAWGKNFYKIEDTALLKNMGTVLLHGGITKKQLRFVKTHLHPSVLINVVLEYPKEKVEKEFPGNTRIFLKLNENPSPVLSSFNDFLLFKSKTVLSDSVKTYHYQLYK